MNYSRTQISSTYLEYAKLTPGAKYNLATSGIEPLPLAELGATIQDVVLNGHHAYGNPELLRRIAEHSAVPSDCVVTAIGTSFANHLAMAALFEPGDDVLIEHPTYEPLLGAARFLGANIIRFARPAENGFRVDMEELRRKLTPRTRAIVLCNLHNPTSALLSETELGEIGELARSSKARVLVDEVYLEAMDPRPRSSFHLGDNFVVTNSLTKGYGLGGLRCGWILAQPDLARCMWRLYDFFGGHNPHAAEALGIIAFDRLTTLQQRAQKILQTNRPVMRACLEKRQEVECCIPDAGTTAAPRLKTGNVDEFCELLRQKYETSVVPGRFFEMPQHFRIGIGDDPEMTRIGFERLAEALDDYAKQRS